MAIRGEEAHASILGHDSARRLPLQATPPVLVLPRDFNFKFQIFVILAGLYRCEHHQWQETAILARGTHALHACSTIMDTPYPGDVEIFVALQPNFLGGRKEYARLGLKITIELAAAKGC